MEQFGKEIKEIMKGQQQALDRLTKLGNSALSQLPPEAKAKINDEISDFNKVKTAIKSGDMEYLQRFTKKYAGNN